MADTLYCMNCKAPQPKPYTSRRRYRCTACKGLVCHHCIDRNVLAKCVDTVKCGKRINRSGSLIARAARRKATS